MLNYVFSTREKVLLIIAAIFAVSIFYYEVAYKGFNEALQQYDTSTIQMEMDTEMVKANRLNQMRTYIDEHSSDTVGTVEQYNNLSNEVAALGEILDNKATDISISWSEPVATGTTVRRVANISFIAPNYTSARDIVSNIADLEYRSVIGDLQLTSRDSNMSESEVTVSMNVTFFETIDGVDNTSGITFTTEEAETYTEE